MKKTNTTKQKKNLHSHSGFSGLVSQNVWKPFEFIAKACAREMFSLYQD